MNQVTIVGNVTDDPELRYTPAGAAVANFTVAVNSRKRVGEQWEDKLEGFFRCTVWRDLAENVSESITKGTRVLVTGKLQEQRWEEKDGAKRSRVEIQVDEIGPSLKWAKATVVKATRTGGGEVYGGGNQGGNQGAQNPPQQAQPQSGGFGGNQGQSGYAQPAPVREQTTVQNDGWDSTPVGDMDSGGF
ncbi:MAG: single-stranded DNA-binding protein [Actinobacteria bacterium]|nr:single-stranded DNA-binding protein [Actinomycetota bacterium]